ncbi:MAG: hypothetical protein D3905_02195 [Candidatus Electrothrix sp. AS4_5]|nr:hypothetical protein [Candidatus Electrothrix gigas]
MKKIFLTVASLIVASTVYAEENVAFNTDSSAPDTSTNIALGARISTLGAGPEVTLGLSDFWNIRAAAHWGSYTLDGDTDNIEYEYDLSLASGLVTVEWNVFAGGFHIDAGLLFNSNSLDAVGQATDGTFTINGVNYTPNQVGTLNGEVDFNSIAPYFGIGWGNPVGNTTWTFFFNLGVVYQGSPDVSLSVDGPFRNDPILLANLKQEEKQLQDEIDQFEYYPVGALGLTYKF